MLRHLLSQRRQVVCSVQGIRLGAQRGPDFLDAPPLPRAVAQRVQDAVLLRHDEILGLRRGFGGDLADLGGELLAENVQREIVDVVAEGVLDLAADGGDAEDDIGAHHGAGDGDPAERGPELERQRDHVHPGDLADGDGIGDGEGGVEHALRPSEDVVERGEVSHDHPMIRAVAQSAVRHDRSHVRGEVGDDFERKVAQVFLGSFDQLARVGFRDR